MHNIDVTDIGKTEYEFENVRRKIFLELKEALRDEDIQWTDTEEENRYMGNTGEGELGEADILVEYDVEDKLLHIEFADDDMKRQLRKAIEARMIESRKFDARKEADALAELYDALPVLPPKDMID